jgi:hypothetical protein
MILNFVEVLEWVNRPNFTHASSFRCCWWGKAIFHACESGFSVTPFLSVVDLAICGCWLCGFWFVDLSMTCGGQENCLIFGVSCRLSFLATPFGAIIWLPECLFAFPQAPSSRSKWLFGKLSEAYFKIHPTCVREIYAWLFGFVKSSFMLWLCLFGVPFICYLVICNLNFSSIIWGFKQTPGKWISGCIDCRWICPSRFVYMFIFSSIIWGFKQTPGNECYDASNVDEFVHLDLFICSSFQSVIWGFQ